MIIPYLYVRKKEIIMFRFGILGAANIGSKFCQAVKMVDDCCVTSVASKSMERAKSFAEKNQVPHWYDSYERLLEQEEIDCAYIDVTPNDHFRLTMMCLERGIPVLCEKAMFCNSKEAETAFGYARERGLFVMEALWSRFLPANNKVKKWVSEGKIGKINLAHMSIGFAAPLDMTNRFYSAELCGGCCTDITCYAYEILRYILPGEVSDVKINANFATTGVDVTEHISMKIGETLADLTLSIETPMPAELILLGTEGKIVLPNPHVASECRLQTRNGDLLEEFKDNLVNGFEYEIAETIRCIREGKIESEVVPHASTIDCAKLFDAVYASKG